MATESETKRIALLQVPMSEEEMRRLEEIANYLGWSKSAVTRYALSKINPEKMAKIDPPGNRRGEPQKEEE